MVARLKATTITICHCSTRLVRKEKKLKRCRAIATCLCQTKYSVIQLTHSLTRTCSKCLSHAARSWAWGAVTYRCQTHPDEADAIDCFGDTVLHWSVFGHPPVDVIQAILAVKPDLAKVANKKGHLPLHVACSYRASPQVIAELLRVYPQAAGIKIPKDGSYPLHLLCDFGCPVESIRLILQEPAGISSITKEDAAYKRRPLAILYGRKNLRVFARVAHSSRNARKQQRIICKQGPGDEQQQQELKRLDDKVVEGFRNYSFWQKAAMLSLVEYTQQILPTDGSIEDIVNSDAVLRACVGNPLCPFSIQGFAVSLHYNKLDQPDENGNLPLHIASSTVGNGSVIRELVLACPKAAHFRNKDGDLPLSILLRHPDCAWEDGIGPLLRVCPSALVDEVRDRRLYPLVWARFSDSPSRMYGFIRSQPDLFQRQSGTSSTMAPVSINSVMA